MGDVVRFPVLYRIAWTDGEREGLVAGYEFRNKRNAESMLHLLQDLHPRLLLWVHHVGEPIGQATPPPTGGHAA